MSTSAVQVRIERCLREFMPEGRLVRAWPLSGGISAAMTAFEIQLLDGTSRRMIARQPSPYKFEEQPDVAVEEFGVLRALAGTGIPVPTPYYLEPESDEVEQRFFIVEYIEGSPDIAPVDRDAYLRRFCDQLVQIHAVDYAPLDPSFRRTQSKGFGQRRERVNDSLREGEIRDVLESVGPITRSNPPVLRHGDFWPGNVLWRDGEIVGVIDWEECLIGEPLADLAICRLDLWWILDECAAYDFTERYQAATNVDLKDLPYWDLCASLRPIQNIDEWAPSYPQLGRPDITAATLRQDHQDFVAQALAKF